MRCPHSMSQAPARRTTALGSAAALAIVVTTTTLTPAPVAAQAAMRAGQWRTTHRLVEGTGPAADLFRRAFATTAQGGSGDSDSCLKKMTLAELLEEVDGAASDEDCRRTTVSQTASRFEVRYTCETGGGTTLLEIVSPERVLGRMEMRLKDPDGKLSHLKLESESRWLKSPCDPGLED